MATFTLDACYKVSAVRGFQCGRWTPELSSAAHFLSGPARKHLVKCTLRKIYLLLFGLVYAQQWDYWSLEYVHIILESLVESLLGVYPEHPTGLLVYVCF